jgi:hypothetical protein
MVFFPVHLHSYSSEFFQVKQACSALSALAGDVSVAMQLMKCDILQPIETVLKSVAQEEVISVLQVVATLSFSSDTVSQKMLTRDMLRSLKLLCAQKNPEASSFLSCHYIKLVLLLLYNSAGI